VNFKRLLEVETGYTTNEPKMAVTEAIEKGFNFSFEGIKDGIWQADIPQPEIDRVLKTMLKKKRQM
jgi:curli production assembly/transport component CsgG